MPRALAAEIAARLVEDRRIASAAEAGPGFINMRLARDVWSDLIGAIIHDEQSIGFTGQLANGFAPFDDFTVW